jgi:hypothetical protein
MILAGAGWCKFSQLDVPQFSTVCSDLGKEKACYLVDVTETTGVQVLKDLTKQNQYLIR